MTFDVHWKREYLLWTSVGYMNGVRAMMKRELGRDVVVRVESAGSWMAMMSEGGTRAELMEKMRQKVRDDPAGIQAVLERLHAQGKAFAAAGKQLDPTKNLREQYATYFGAISTYTAEIFTSFYLVEAVSEVFHEYVMEVAPEQATEVIAAYSIPSDRARILRLGDFFAEHEDIDERIAYVKKTYPGIGSIDPFTKPYSDKEIRSFAESFEKPSPLPRTPVLLENEALVHLYQDILFLKDRRDDYRRESFYYGYNLMKALADELGISAHELSFLLPHELDQLENIEPRKQAYIATLTDELHIEAGDVEEKFESTSGAGSGAVKGTVGSKGTVQGTAQIIRSMQDVGSFQKGNVLVAVTTDPNFMSAMQQAVAVVTDEGGIACHAAIVSREMGIPCVVGTGNATTVLKDGDTIEVNGKTGVVKSV